MATGTHGSGVRNGSLSTAVTALEMVTPDGELMRLSRSADPDRFPGAVVALGCLGVVTALTLRVEPAYEVAQVVYEELPFATLLGALDEIMSVGYSVSLFTTWGDDVVDQVWVKRRTDDPAPDARVRPGWTPVEPRANGIRSAGMSPAACTPQLGVAGPVARAAAPLPARPHAEQRRRAAVGVPGAAPVRTRTPCGRCTPSAIGSHPCSRCPRSGPSPRTTCGSARPTAPTRWACTAPGSTTRRVCRRSWPILEEALAPFDARPHWGKLFGVAPERVRALYPRLGDFQSLRHELDPANKLGNELVDRYLGPS